MTMIMEKMMVVVNIDIKKKHKDYFWIFGKFQKMISGKVEKVYIFQKMLTFLIKLLN